MDSFTRNRDPTDEQPYFPSIRKFNRILLVVNCGDEILEAMGQSVTFLQALQDSGGFDKLQYNSSKSAFCKKKNDYLNLCLLGTRAHAHTTDLVLNCASLACMTHTACGSCTACIKIHAALYIPPACFTPFALTPLAGFIPLA